MAYTFAQLEDFWLGAGGNRRLAPTMAAIGLAESRGENVRQRGQPLSRTGWGIWQITPGDPSLLDPRRNARAAVAKEETQGLGAWTTYTSGAYRRYLPAGSGVPRGRRSGGGGGWGALALSHFAGVDQGVDFNGAGPIPALGDGRVTDVGSSHIIEGGSYPVVVYELDAPPVDGSRYVYVAENFAPTVKPGKRIKLGDPIGEAAGSYPYIEIGWNQGPRGWAPVAPLNPNPHGAKQAGRSMWAFIQQTETGAIAPGATGVPIPVGSRSRPGVGDGGGGWIGDAWGTFESDVASAAGGVGGLFSGLIDSVSAPLDFLKAALWLINPLNWLRAAEIMVGFVLVLVGILIAVGADRQLGAVASRLPAE